MPKAVALILWSVQIWGHSTAVCGVATCNSWLQLQGVVAASHFCSKVCGGFVKYKFREAWQYTPTVIPGLGKEGRGFLIATTQRVLAGLKFIKYLKKHLLFVWLVKLWIKSCIKSRHWYKKAFPRPLTPTQSGKFFQEYFDAFKYVLLQVQSEFVGISQ